MLLLAALTAATALATAPDSIDVSLSEVEVTASTPLRLTGADAGIVRLNSAVLDRMPRLLGHADPLRALQAMPLVTTAGDLSGGLAVQGGDPSQNVHLADGAPVRNPVHLLGLFSVFNGDHFREASVNAAIQSTGAPDCTGALVCADSPSHAPDAPQGSFTAGLISSGAAVRLPLCSGRAWVAAAGRISYLSKLYPGMLRFDHAGMLYDFGDANIVAGWRTAAGTLRASLFLSDDRLKLHDRLYDASGRMGWGNLAAALTWDGLHGAHKVYISRYNNSFRFSQNIAEADLPSRLLQYGWTGSHHVRSVTLTCELYGSRTVAQYNSLSDAIDATTDALAAAVGVDWSAQLHGTTLAAALRTVYYRSDSFGRVYPLPRITLGRRLGSVNIRLSAGRYVQYLHMVRQSGSGLPCDYFVNADRTHKPVTSNQLSLRLAGSAPAGLDWSAELFGKTYSHLTEYGGSVLDMLTPGNDPLKALHSGSGRAYGVSLMLARTTGRLRGWLGYTLSRRENKVAALGPNRFPSQHDRPHDLKGTLMWDCSPRLSLTASYTLASGTPYTRAAYGYVIGGNVIFEYMPHNSSRLPAYRRLDLAANWRLPSSKRLEQSLNISLYNALFDRNVIFRYTAFSPLNGIHDRSNSLKTCIPSISYTLSF